MPGICAQIEQKASLDLILAACARIDFHSEFGTQFNPRLSAPDRPGSQTIRGSFGGGFFAPTPFVNALNVGRA